MSHINNFEKVLNEIEYADRAEKSLKEFNNWILGISIGISALIITQYKDFNIDNCFVLITYKIILTLSMLNTLLVGTSKYLIYVRDTRLSIYYGKMKKLIILAQTRNTPIEEVKEEFNKLYEERIVEFNKIEAHGRLLNISLLTTGFVVLVTGVFIVIAI